MAKCIKCNSHDIIESEKGIYCCNCGWDSEKEKYAKRKTNADRIRSMSDEELADFFCKVKSDYQWLEHEFPSEEESEEWVEWLQSEVEEQKCI